MNRRDLFKAVPTLAAAGLVSPSARGASGHARLRSAICAYSYRDPLKEGTMTYDDIIRTAVELDIDGIDMTVYWFPNTSDQFLLPLKRLAYKNAVEIYSIAIRTDMCQPTPEKQQAEIAKVRQWLDVAEKLGAGHIRVFGGAVPRDATEDQAADWCASVLSRAAEYAAKKGIILGIENHGGITSRAERILQIVRKVDSPWVGVNLDTGNFLRDAYHQLEMILPYAASVQVKTQIRGDDGKPQPSDWDRIAKMLVNGGYRGYLALEYELKEDPKIAMPPLLAKLRDTCRKYSV